MQSTTFSHVVYVAGDTKLGEQRLTVALEAQPLWLGVRQRGGGNRLLLSIPWTNIRRLDGCVVDKSYVGKALADLWDIIPLLQLTRMGSRQELGLTITYWDEAVQREQFPTFAIGSQEERLARLQHAILDYRDRFVLEAGRQSRPDRR